VALNANVAIFLDNVVKLATFCVNTPPKRAAFGEERKEQSYSNAPVAEKVKASQSLNATAA